MTIQVIRYILGGLLFNTLCGALVGMLLAVTLKKRLSKGRATALLGLISALLIGGSLWILFSLHPDSLLRIPAGLLVYPFYNKLTAFTRVTGMLALLLDAAWMTGMGTLAWQRIRRRQETSRFPPRTTPSSPIASEHDS
jgi:hypothetical protein